MNRNYRKAVLTMHDQLTGRHILARLEELNRTQWLSRDELLALQRSKLLRLMEYANQYVPYYQRIFKEVGFHPADLRRDLANLNKIPILTKAIIRKNWDDLLTTEPKRRGQLSKLSTSGSTGEPLVFMQDRDFRDAVTADIQRHIGWGGWNLGDPQAFIWGAKRDPTFRQRLRSGLIDWVWNRFLMNAHTLTDANQEAFVKLIRRDRPRILFGYPTAIQVFARFVRARQLFWLTFNAVFTSAERLLPNVREEIEETFKAQVFNRYGTLDLGGVACECEAHTGLHLSVENNYVEILVDGQPATPEQGGEVIVTNLNNMGMPFIRYQVGDLARVSEEANCPCGRASPRLSNIEGRITELFQTRAGSYVRAAFSGGFSCLAHPTIVKFQVIQKSLDKMVVRLVPNGEIPQAVLGDITRTIQTTFGENVCVDFVFLDNIPALASGKHQYAISELN